MLGLGLGGLGARLRRLRGDDGGDVVPRFRHGALEALGIVVVEREKVSAILNQIQGRNHDGTRSPGVPSVFGMNFQAVSVGQKLAKGLRAALDKTASAKN